MDFAYEAMPIADHLINCAKFLADAIPGIEAYAQNISNENHREMWLNQLAKYKQELAQLDLNQDTEILPGAPGAEIQEILMQEIVGDYDTPDQVPEWAWVESNASFAHINNGTDGVWEFILNLSRTFEHEEIPESLKPVLAKARAEGLAYLVFHQGT